MKESEVTNLLLIAVLYQFIISFKTKRFQTFSSFPTQAPHHLPFLNQFSVDKVFVLTFISYQMWSPPHTSSASHLSP